MTTDLTMRGYKRRVERGDRGVTTWNWENHQKQFSCLRSNCRASSCSLPLIFGIINDITEYKIYKLLGIDVHWVVFVGFTLSADLRCLCFIMVISSSRVAFSNVLHTHWNFKLKKRLKREEMVVNKWRQCKNALTWSRKRCVCITKAAV